MRFLVVLMACLIMSCAGNLATGYRAVAIVGQVRDQVTKTISEICEPKHEQCASEHGTGTEQFSDCIKDCAKVGYGWTQIVLPAIDTSIAAALLALDTARAKNQKDVPWWEKLRPGLCRLLDALQDWKNLIGKQKSIDWIAKVQVVSVIVCP